MDRIIGFDQQLLIQIGFQFFNSLVCFFILYMLLYKPLKNFMAKRTKKISSELEEAKKKLSEANDLKLKYEYCLKDIEAKRNEILEVAHYKATENKNLIINKAYEEAEKIKEQAKLESLQNQKQMHDEFKKQIINVSWIVITDVLKNNIDDVTHEKLNQDCLKKIEDLDIKKLVSKKNND